jgi:cytochrome c2
MAGLVVAAGLGAVGVVSIAQSEPPGPDLAGGGDVMNGWRVFNEKQCIDCHAIWGQGASVGPDLGRLRSGRLSGDRLAGIMWNHIPKMLARMKQAGRPPETMTVAEMADTFALINFVRQLDEPGNPAQGKRILQAKGCTECHAIDTAGGNVGPDLAKWGSYANPIIWAQMMWEHAPVMEAAMRRSGMQWPKLEGADLVHIVAYVRSAGITGAKTYLRPGSIDRGRRLFVQKKCNSCHPGEGPDLAEIDLPTSVGALASRMWNHSPEMTRIMYEKDVQRQPVSAQELADMLSYVLMLRNHDSGGDPNRGMRVFKQKGCAQCHESEEMAADVGPSLQQLGRSAATADMAAAMWNHGETMLERMTEAGLIWPMFDDDEMVDMLAYLKAAGKAEPTGGEAGIEDQR